MDFEKYSSYTIEDFLEDADFRSWVLHPNGRADGQWKTFFKKYPEQEGVAGRARELLLEMKEYFKPEKFNNQPIDEIFLQQIKRNVETQPQAVSGQRNRRFFIQRLSIAGSLLLLIGLFSWYWLSQRGDTMQVFTTTYGERETIELPDGSIVILNANSKIRTARKWKKDTDRLVWLEGEAHFTVVPQPVTRAKFSVITNDLSVNVVGTVFNVRAREKNTQVTLEEGRVSLELKEEGVEEQPDLKTQASLSKPPIMMVPGQQVQYSAKTQQFKKVEKVNVMANSSWKDGMLVFDGITLEELGRIITETFGYPVEFKDTATMNQKITGSVPAENDLDLLLETVEQAFDDFKIVKKDNLLIFE